MTLPHPTHKSLHISVACSDVYLPSLPWLLARSAAAVPSVDGVGTPHVVTSNVADDRHYICWRAPSRVSACEAHPAPAGGACVCLVVQGSLRDGSMHCSGVDPTQTATTGGGLPLTYVRPSRPPLGLVPPAAGRMARPRQRTSCQPSAGGGVSGLRHAGGLQTGSGGPVGGRWPATPCAVVLLRTSLWHPGAWLAVTIYGC